MTPKSSNNNGWKFVTVVLIILGLIGTLVALNASAISDLRRDQMAMSEKYVQKERYLTDMQCLREELAKIQAKLDTLLMRQSTVRSRDADRPN